MRFGRYPVLVAALLATAFAVDARAQDAFADLPPIPPALKAQFDDTGVDTTYWRLGKMRWEVAVRLLDLGRVDEARALYDTLLADRYRNPLDVALGRIGLAGIAAFDGRHAEAAAMYAAVRTAMVEAGLEREQRGIGLTYLAWVVIDEAGVLHRLGRDAEALKLIDAQLAVENDMLGRTAPLVDARATALEGLGRMGEAEGARTRALQLLRIGASRSADVRAVDIAAAEVRLAVNLVAQGKAAQAEPLLDSALKVYAARLDPAHPDALEARGALARLRLTVLNKPAAALDELRRANAAILARSDRGRPDQRADNRLARHRDLFRDRVAAGWAVGAAPAGPAAIAPGPVPPAKARIAAAHGEAVGAVAFSRDGTHLLSGAEDGSLILWDVASGEARARIAGQDMWRIKRIGVLPDGRFWTASTDRKLRVWAADASASTVAVDYADARVGAVAALSPDGRSAVIADPGRQLTVVDLASGRRATTPLHWYRVDDIAFAPDGRSIALGEWTNDPDKPAGAGEARICLHALADAGRGVCRAVFTARSLHYTPDGKAIVAAAFSGESDRFDAVTLERLRDGKGPLGGGTFALSTDGARAAASSDDGGVQVTDALTGAPVARLDGHTGDVTAMAFSPDGRVIATGAEDRTVRLWSVADGRSLHVLGDASGFARHMKEIRNVAFSPDGRRILSGGLDNARLWDAETGVQLATHAGWSVGFSPDGKRFLSGGVVHDSATGTVVRTLQTDGWTGTYLPNGHILVSVGEATATDSHLQIVDANGRAAGRLPWAFGDRLEVAPQGDLVAVVGRIGGFRLWNSRTGQPVSEPVANAALRFHGFTPKGDEMIVSLGTAVAIFGVADQSAPRRLFILPDWMLMMEGVAVAADQASAVGWNSAGAHRAPGFAPPPKDAPPQAPPASMPLAVKGRVAALVLSGDGTRAAIGYDDGDLAFVDMATGVERARGRAHEGGVTQLRASPDGRSLLSVGKDRGMSLWSFETGRLVRHLGD